MVLSVLPKVLNEFFNLKYIQFQVVYRAPEGQILYSSPVSLLIPVRDEPDHDGVRYNLHVWLNRAVLLCLLVVNVFEHEKDTFPKQLTPEEIIIVYLQGMFCFSSVTFFIQAAMLLLLFLRNMTACCRAAKQIYFLWILGHSTLNRRKSTVLVPVRITLIRRSLPLTFLVTRNGWLSKSGLHLSCKVLFQRSCSCVQHFLFLVLLLNPFVPLLVFEQYNASISQWKLMQVTA